MFNAEGDDERFTELPFYVRNVMMDGTIDNTMFFEIFSRSLEKHREYYRHLFSYVGTDTLDSYLHRIYTPCIKEDIWYLVDRELFAYGRHRRPPRGASSRATPPSISSPTSSPGRSSRASSCAFTTSAKTGTCTTSRRSKT